MLLLRDRLEGALVLRVEVCVLRGEVGEHRFELGHTIGKGGVGDSEEERGERQHRRCGVGGAGAAEVVQV